MSGTAQAHFDPARFQRHMAATSLKRAVFGAIAVGWVASFLFAGPAELVGLALMTAGLAGWVIGNTVSHRTGRLAVACAQLAATDPGSVELENTLAQAMQRFTMYRTVRVMLYHQLAVLRYTRREHAETVAICGALLGERDLALGGALRTRLLLLLADSSLHRRDVHAAWSALAQLSRCRLELLEQSHLLEVQTRYELMCGYHRRALNGLINKVAVADLLPPPASAEVHRMFAHAAHACARPNTAAWLNERADLLWPRDADARAAPAAADLVRPGLA